MGVIMNVEIIYRVVKALSLEEQRLLFIKLKKDFVIVLPLKNIKRTIMNNEEVIEYLIKNVLFKSKSIKKTDNSMSIACGLNAK